MNGQVEVGMLQDAQWFSYLKQLLKLLTRQRDKAMMLNIIEEVGLLTHAFEDEANDGSPLHSNYSETYSQSSTSPSSASTNPPTYTTASPTLPTSPTTPSP